MTELSCAIVFLVIAQSKGRHVLCLLSTSVVYRRIVNFLYFLIHDPIGYASIKALSVGFAVIFARFMSIDFFQQFRHTTQWFDRIERDQGHWE
jgi:hypothetical protein